MIGIPAIVKQRFLNFPDPLLNAPKRARVVTIASIASGWHFFTKK